MHIPSPKTSLFASFVFILTACGGGSSSKTTTPVNTEPDEPRAFSLSFAAVGGESSVDCDNMLSGFGPDASDSIGVRDLRFYVSNIKFYDASGEELELSFDDNEFQYNSDQGFVALIDLTSNDSGTCQAESGNGTARTNSSISGTVEDQVVADVSFDVGVPQAVMKAVIANNTAEDTPSPLNEMHWSWVGGHRHFLLDFQVMDTVGTYGEGFVHIGSRGCGADGQNALADREQCDLINTPRVMLEGFDPDTKTVNVDVAEALKSLDFLVDSAGEEQSSGPGVTCHSAAVIPDCPVIFTNFGLDIDTGVADASANTVFSSSD